MSLYVFFFKKKKKKRKTTRSDFLACQIKPMAEIDALEAISVIFTTSVHLTFSIVLSWLLAFTWYRSDLLSGPFGPMESWLFNLVVLYTAMRNSKKSLLRRLTAVASSKNYPHRQLGWTCPRDLEHCSAQGIPQCGSGSKSCIPQAPGFLWYVHEYMTKPQVLSPPLSRSLSSLLAE